MFLDSKHQRECNDNKVEECGRIAGVHSTEQSEGIMKSSIYYRKDL